MTRSAARKRSPAGRAFSDGDSPVAGRPDLGPLGEDPPSEPLEFVTAHPGSEVVLIQGSARDEIPRTLIEQQRRGGEGRRGDRRLTEERYCAHEGLHVQRGRLRHDRIGRGQTQPPVHVVMVEGPDTSRVRPEPRGEFSDDLVLLLTAAEGSPVGTIPAVAATRSRPSEPDFSDGRSDSPRFASPAWIASGTINRPA